MATFRTLDKAGDVIKEDDKSYDHYKRYSMKCAAQQKHLDSLYTPEAVEGRIIDHGHPIHFRFVDGKSSHYHPKNEVEKT